MFGEKNWLKDLFQSFYLHSAQAAKHLFLLFSLSKSVILLSKALHSENVTNVKDWIAWSFRMKMRKTLDSERDEKLETRDNFHSAVDFQT